MQRQKMFILGDSIAHGAWDVSGGWVARLKMSLHSAYLSVPARAHPGPLVYNLGVPGDTSEDATQRAKSEISARNIRDPGHVTTLIALGTNDVAVGPAGACSVSLRQFEENMTEIATSMLRIGDVVLIGMPPAINPISRPRRPADIRRYDQCIRAVAIKTGCGFIPLLPTFDQDLHLSSDGVHPNSAGHEFIFRRVAAHLEIAIDAVDDDANV